tara:strand:+ start:3260 stop:3424 length:165 start_codon:yes stop_codon:yes gene_type:complete
MIKHPFYFTAHRVLQRSKIVKGFRLLSHQFQPRRSGIIVAYGEDQVVKTMPLLE